MASRTTWRPSAWVRGPARKVAAGLSDQVRARGESTVFARWRHTDRPDKDAAGAGNPRHELR